jgi:hypothetical protein
MGSYASPHGRAQKPGYIGPARKERVHDFDFARIERYLTETE